MDETPRNTTTAPRNMAGGLILLGLVFAVLFVIAAISNIQAVDNLSDTSRGALDIGDGAGPEDYVAGIASSAGFAVVAAVCWVGAAIVSALQRR